MAVVSMQRGISLSPAVSRQLEIYKNDEAREAVRDIKDGNTLLVGGTSDDKMVAYMQLQCTDSTTAIETTSPSV